ncbi:MAG: CehA/McbA family metallohydrolase [Actinobacteria bacterium]|nr:CehA/McbA family metallohydrolase [Actinomycetota bacterium]
MGQTTGTAAQNTTKNTATARGASALVIASAITAVVAMAGLTAPAATAQQPADAQRVPACVPNEVLKLSGAVEHAAQKTYLLVPFEVPRGVTRVEVGYTWAPLESTTLDLGLWDPDGYDNPDGFRGWGGSRQGRLDKGMAHSWVQADSADRGFTPGPVEPGTWHVELGLAEVADAGATYNVEVLCSDGPVGEAPTADPVDPDHVANDAAGWYRADFHMHSYHSAPNAPSYDEFVNYARAARLDILPVTEYVVTRHQNELGAAQRANPDLLIWPGREIITYFGHATVFGETPSTVEYRHGFEDVTLRGIQTDSVADGAVFGIAHPTVFPEAQFGSTCRGCEFQLGDDIDWSAVTTVEVVTNDTTVGGVENPFIQTAIEFWQARLNEGHRITAVSGSDDKAGPELGSSATMIYAEELSRAGVSRALRAGRAYVQVRGAAGSPTIEFSATADGTTALMGETLVAPQGEFLLEVAGAAGQSVHVIRNGVETASEPVGGETHTMRWTGERDPATEGPLGTYWRIEVRDAVGRTVISNPIFLADTAPVMTEPSTTQRPADTADTEPADRAAVTDAAAETDTPWGVGVGWVWALFGVLALALVAVIRTVAAARSSHPRTTPPAT